MQKGSAWRQGENPGVPAVTEGPRLARADRITRGAHVGPASGVWLHIAFLPRLVFFRNKGYLRRCENNTKEPFWEGNNQQGCHRGSFRNHGRSGVGAGRGWHADSPRVCAHILGFPSLGGGGCWASPCYWELSESNGQHAEEPSFENCTASVDWLTGPCKMS